MLKVLRIGTSLGMYFSSIYIYVCGKQKAPAGGMEAVFGVVNYSADDTMETTSQ